MFSEGFSEGQTRDINEGLPSDFVPHIEYYDYQSDSDLEDEPSEEEVKEREQKPRENDDIEEATEEDEPKAPRGPPDSDSQVLPTTTPSEKPSQSSQHLVGVEHDRRLAPISVEPPNLLQF